MHDLDRTLVAVATPSGRGGIGAIRISGPEAYRIAAGLFRERDREDRLAAGAPRFGRFVGADGRAVDHGYLVLFEARGAFTGEPTAELWTHGSPAVQRALVEAALAAGAVAAGPGEFTYRALRHGRLDMARAEAVRDLVAARTVWQARVALAQAEGALSRRLAPIREALAELMARAEAAIEFVDEHETGLAPEVLAAGVERIGGALGELLEGYRSARLVREGAVVAITGLPNVGKSSLFNRLLERDRAIVAATPGTTRDTLEEEVDLEGLPVRLVDTAGIREADEAVEGEGVRRARAAAASADVVLLVLDATRPLQPAEQEGLSPGGIGDRSPATVVAGNKADRLEGDAPAVPPGTLLVSALTGEGIGDLRGALRTAAIGSAPVDDPVLTDARHAAALREASRALEAAAVAGRSGLGEEAVLEDLRTAMRHVGQVTGAFDVEEIYDRIFATFCIGK